MSVVKDSLNGSICTDFCGLECGREAETVDFAGRFVLYRNAVLYDDPDADTVKFRDRKCYDLPDRRGIIQRWAWRGQQSGIKENEPGVISSCQDIENL